MAQAYEYALEEVPTQHLEESFKRAVKAKQRKHDNFVISGIDIGAEYLDMLPELAERARAHSAQQDKLLMAGHGSVGRMSLSEWKERHNLPPEWRLGEPYPPESDLFDKPVPPRHSEVVPAYSGRWDAKWYIRKAPLPTAAQKAAQREAARRQMAQRAAERAAPVDAGAWSRIRGADLESQPQRQTTAKAANDDPAEIQF